ncbi:MAG: preprotein translocase subunit SecA [Bacteroidota bacterium]
MLDKITKSLSKIFGSKSERDIKELSPYVALVNEEFDKLSSLSNDELRNKTLEFKERIAEHLEGIDADIDELKKDAAKEEDFEIKEDLYDQIDELTKQRDKHLEDILMVLLPEAFAVVKETARRFTENKSLEVTATQHDRELSVSKPHVQIKGDKAHWANSWEAGGNMITWNMIHYDVQIIGGVVLHKGKIAEMQTGEGKTLVSTFPSYLNALSGQGVHLITVNDYLAKRDAEWMGPIFEFLFLTVDCIDKYKPHSEERTGAYNCDITYGTNNEFGFDYLRDNMVRNPEELVQGKHHFAMIDEVDSVLIDDARTPLIISGPVPKGDEQEYGSLKGRINNLVEAQRQLCTGYLAEAKKLIKEGRDGAEEGEGGMALLRAFRGLPKYRPLTKYLSEPGIKVKLQKVENYYMQEQSKNMHLVDAPLYFTIEEKTNQVDLNEPGAEYMSKGLEDKDFFIMPDIGAEIIEIDNREEDSEEDKSKAKEKLLQDYSIKAKRLHSVHQLLKAYTLFHLDDQYIVDEGKVKIVDEQTGRIMEGRRYSDGLHQALEAKENVKVEAATQTYATVTLQNYFRMYHKLSGMTGTAETEAGEFWDIYKLDVVSIPTNRPIARDDREDLVYKTALEKYNAVVDEIAKLTEAGRPVLVGTTSVEISELLSRFLTRQNIKHNVLNAKQHEREAHIVATAGQPGQVTIATNMAGRGTDIKLGEGVKKAGGLAIIGTERHESRRVDRQLRGRAGRQGDPGSSQFFVSLEDNLMRLFGSERIAKLMDRMGYEKGEVIQHSMVTKSIERAQKKVEENHFGTRKRLLEYDDVMNIQREAIYKKRRHALYGDRLSVDLYNMFADLSDEVVDYHFQGNKYDEFKLDAFRYFGLEPNIDAAEFADGNEMEVVSKFTSQVMEAYQRKMDLITTSVMPVIKRVFEEEGHQYKNIAIPFSDGKKTLQLVANLEEAVNTSGKSIITSIEKSIALALIDDAWKEHLRAMDELKESTQAAQFEQKDPLVIYKVEAFGLFQEFISNVNREVISFLSRGTVTVKGQDDVRKARRTRTDMSNMTSNKDAKAAAESAGRGSSKPSTFKRKVKKVGRNDPCPCGSGKKYKHCCGNK